MKTKTLMLFPIVLILYTVLTYLSNDMYLPALFDLMQDFKISNSVAQLTLTAWFFGAASMQLIMGPLSDRFGRRPVLLGGGFLFILSTIVCGITPSITLLFAARFIQGSALCSLVVAGYSTIHELYDFRQAVRVLAWMGSIGILAPAFGPLVGGVILQVASWRYIFLLLAILASIVLFFLFKWMPETNSVEKRIQFDIRAVFKSYYAIITNKEFILSTLVLSLSYSGLIAWLTIGPLLVTQAFHYSPLMFGFFQALVFSAFILGNTFLKFAIEFLSIRKIINFGVMTSLLGALFSLIFSILFPHILITFIIPLMIYAGGTALTYGTLQRTAIETSHEPMGLRMAIFSSMMGVSSVCSSGVASIIYNGTSIVLGCFMALVAVIAFVVNLMRK